MRNLHLAIVIVLSLVTTVFGDGVIHRQNMVPNKAPGFCSWCCIGMIAKELGIKELQDVIADREKKGTDWTKERYWTGREWAYRWKQIPAAYGSDDTIEAYLKEKKVKYWLQPTGTKKTEILEKTIKDDMPVVVGLKNIYNPRTRQVEMHAIVLLAYKEKSVDYIDPNVPGYVCSGSRAWFDEHWDGHAILLYKPE